MVMSLTLTFGIRFPSRVFPFGGEPRHSCVAPKQIRAASDAQASRRAGNPSLTVDRRTALSQINVRAAPEAARHFT
jgi:hypothetical protein